MIESLKAMRTPISILTDMEIAYKNATLSGATNSHYPDPTRPNMSLQQLNEEGRNQIIVLLAELAIMQLKETYQLH